jgi:hypothetical protein
VRARLLAQHLVHAIGGIAAHRWYPVGVGVQGKVYAGVLGEVLNILRMRVRVSRVAKELCLC